MKLTFKDLKQQKFVIEAEPSETVADVKNKISAEKGWEPSNQKLIYSGKILQDDKQISTYNIEEKGFIVCMVTKPKPAPAASSSKAAPSTPAPAAPQTPSAPPAAPVPASTSTGNAPATPSPAPGNPAASDSRFDDPSTLTMGAERDAAVANMESMGFPRADIDRAMRAAFFNPDRAVEYLLNGIPEGAGQEQQAQAAQRQAPADAAASPPPQGDTTAAQPTTGGDNEPINLFEAAAQAGQNRGGSGGARSGGGQGAGGTGAGQSAGVANLDFLRNNPQFQQLRQIVHQQPQMLEPILQQIANGNPQVAQVINSHPEQFMELLSEDIDEDAPIPPGAQTIAVSEEEREAIERLCRLGFERDLVIQAYFACDKNEELAANFLFDQPEDEDQPQ